MMRSGLRALVLTSLVVFAGACAEQVVETDKGVAADDDGLVAVGELGAADGHGPFKGSILWDGAAHDRIDADYAYHLWQFDVGYAGQALIEATSETGDMYLAIYRDAGNRWQRIARNDDCDRSTYDSCIDRNLPEGSYLVLVSTYDALVWGAWDDADYDLTVTCQRGDCTNLLCGVEASRDGATEFVSADQGQSNYWRPWERNIAFDAVPTPDVLEGATSDRTVEEGDIYSVLSDGYILNLNTYRGLQVIDVSDPDAPVMAGRARVYGTPVELYVVDDFAYVLLNNFNGYYGTRGDISFNRFQGALLVAVDLSDPSSPQIVAREQLTGNIRTSRLTRGGSGTALYVVADTTEQTVDDRGNSSWASKVVVTSYAVEDGRITPVSRLDLGGYVADIQATPEALLVARNDWRSGDRFSRVGLVDITDPGGRMIEGADVAVTGFISNKYNMDLRGGVLRVVSGRTWSGTNANHVETFDATDISELTPIAQCQFGDGQSLFATLFMEDRAFFVTYQRVDPFHAFAIGADGQCEERSEFIVSGWNNFLRPVFGGDRLIGIGMNDEDGRTMSVSLYDTTDLDNAEPLIARADVEAERSWSEANFDDRAFTVLEGAMATQADDGTLETGLVLLPYTGWTGSEYLSAVQIFTFSENGLTRRGLMTQTTPVRRTFMADDITANLSDQELRLFALDDPDDPTALGRLELAPNYSELLVYGGFGVRLNNTSDFFYGWWGSKAEPPPSSAEIISLAGDPDTAAPLAEVQIAANARIMAINNLMVVMDSRWETSESGEGRNVSTFEVFDLSDPSQPDLVGTVDTELLQSGGYGYGGPAIRCFRGPCGPINVAAEQYIVGDAVVFATRDWQQEELSTEEICNDPVQPVCEIGEECPVLQPNCWTNTRWRNWQSLTLHVLDLSDPTSPRFHEPIALPREEGVLAVVADAHQLWVTTNVPALVEGDTQTYARYSARTLDLSDASSPMLSDPVNVPGQVFATDGPRVFSTDYRWNAENLEQVLVSTVVCDGTAYEQARVQFEGQNVQRSLLDEAGHVLVSHSQAWWARDETNIVEGTQLSVFDQETLGQLTQLSVDSWATLETARAGRALFRVPGGLLVLNVEDGSAPTMQAYFPLMGWPSTFELLSNRLMFAAGRYGVFAFDLDGFNLFE